MTKPINVLLITADQWRAECLSALGHPTVKTPTLDALAAEGVLFRNHFTQAMPCGPSRTSLLTGMYMMNHRSLTNGTPLDARFTNVALEIRKLGYEPSLIGYTDISADPRGRDPNDPALKTYSGTLPGFVQLVPGSEGSKAWMQDLAAKGFAMPAAGESIYDPVPNYPGAAERGHTFAPPRYSAAQSDTAFDVDCALRFLAREKQPWFLHLSLLRPHPPFIAPEPYNARYHPDQVPPFRGAPSSEEEARLHPFIAFRLRESRYLAREGHDPKRIKPEPASMRQLRSTYYGLMSEVDDQLGRLFALLKQIGAYEDTLIIFTTDHGEQLWDHWLLGKEYFYDQSAHIPLIIRAPGAAAERARGRRVEAFTGGIDVMPTILDWLGAEPPVQCDGMSLAPWLRGETPARWREEIHWELDFRDVVQGSVEQELGLSLDQCSLAVIRGRRYKYVHFAALPPLLFDLEADPDERVNRAEDPALAGVLLRLTQKMLSWRIAYADRTLTGIKLTAKGPVECPPSRRRLG